MRPYKDWKVGDIAYFYGDIAYFYDPNTAIESLAKGPVTVAEKVLRSTDSKQVTVWQHLLNGKRIALYSNDNIYPIEPIEDQSMAAFTYGQLVMPKTPNYKIKLAEVTTPPEGDPALRSNQMFVRTLDDNRELVSVDYRHWVAVRSSHEADAPKKVCVPLAPGEMSAADKKAEPSSPNYHDHPLYPVLMKVIEQATKGKGKRHGGDSIPFMDQPWKHYADMHGRGFLTGQAAKKLEEAVSKPLNIQFEDEVLGAIAYAAMAILHTWDKS